MNKLISELVTYGMKKELVDASDKVYVINKLLELFHLEEFEWRDKYEITPENIKEIFFYAFFDA